MISQALQEQIDGVNDAAQRFSNTSPAWAMAACIFQRVGNLFQYVQEKSDFETAKEKLKPALKAVGKIVKELT